MIIEGDKWMEEVKKVLSKKNIIIFVAFFVLNIALFMNCQYRQGSVIEDKSYKSIYMELVQECSDKSYDEITEYIDILSKQSKENDDSVALNAIAQFRQKVEYIYGYNSEINRIIDNSRRMSTFSIFSGENNYSRINIEKTCSDYEKLKNLELKPVNDLAVDSLYRYKYINIIMFAYMLIILYQLYAEQENGMLPMIRSAAAGRFRLGVVRQLIIAVMIIIGMAVIYISTIVCAYMQYGGFEYINEPVQTIEGFSKYVYLHTQWQAMLYAFVINTLIVYVLAACVWLLLVLIRDRKLVFALMAGVYGIEYICYTKISIQSIYRWFRQINLCVLLDFNPVMKSYLNIGTKSWVMHRDSFIILVCAIIAVVVTFVTPVIFANKRQFSGIVAVDRLKQRINIIVQRVLLKAPAFVQEIYKIITSGNGMFLIIVLVCISIYFCVDSQMHYSQEAVMLDNLYETDGGSDYEELEQKVDDISDRALRAILAKTELMRSNVRYWEVEGYEDILDEAESASKELTKYSEVIQRLEYIANLKESKDIDAYLMSDRGYEEIIGEYGIRRWLKLGLCLSVVVVLMMSEAFHKEYESGMAELVYSTKNGHERIYGRKVITGMILVSALYIIVCAIDITYINSFYHLIYPEAPVQSLTFMEDFQPRMTIMEYIAVQYIMIWCLLLFLSVLICVVMIFARNKNTRAYTFAVMLVAVMLTIIVINNGMKNCILTISIMLLISIALAITGVLKWCKKI